MLFAPFKLNKITENVFFSKALLAFVPYGDVDKNDYKTSTGEEETDGVKGCYVLDKAQIAADDKQFVNLG